MILIVRLLSPPPSALSPELSSPSPWTGFSRVWPRNASFQAATRSGLERLADASARTQTQKRPLRYVSVARAQTKYTPATDPCTKQRSAAREADNADDSPRFLHTRRNARRNLSLGYATRQYIRLVGKTAETCCSQYSGQFGTLHWIGDIRTVATAQQHSRSSRSVWGGAAALPRSNAACGLCLPTTREYCTPAPTAAASEMRVARLGGV